MLFFACQIDGQTNYEYTEVEDDQADIWYKLPEINLTNWKVTLPIGNSTSLAGNYLSSTDDNAFSSVKYYSLDVEH